MLPLAKIRKWFRPSPETLAARRLFATVMAEARRDEYFVGGGVADTTDGRFDLVLVHLILALRRLRDEGVEGRDLAQRLFDAAFADFDEALRELGVGDLTVPKRMRKMAEAFYGRVEAYETALSKQTDASFDEALRKNLYRGAPVSAEAVSTTRQALYAFAQRLRSSSRESLLSGALTVVPR